MGKTTRFSLTEGAAPQLEGGSPGAPDSFSAWRTQPIQWDVTSRHWSSSVYQYITPHALRAAQKIDNQRCNRQSTMVTWGARGIDQKKNNLTAGVA